MRKSLYWMWVCGATLLSTTVLPVAEAQELKVPGLVTYLYHSLNMTGRQGGFLFLPNPGGVPGQYFVIYGWDGRQRVDARYPVLPPPPSVAYSGGDLGAPSGHGFNWFAMAGAGPIDPGQYRALPPGLVIALKHSRNQANSGIVAFGSYDPATGPTALNGFIKRLGGDLGAPSGVGFAWYESTDTGDTNWSLIDRLPPGTVVGLRHTRNLHGTWTQFVWSGKYTCRGTQPGNPPAACDPTNGSILPPSGFVRMQGGDLGAPAGNGFVWYEKL
jgi:hypothetical protein